MYLLGGTCAHRHAHACEGLQLIHARGGGLRAVVAGCAAAACAWLSDVGPHAAGSGHGSGLLQQGGRH